MAKRNGQIDKICDDDKHCLSEIEKKSFVSSNEAPVVNYSKIIETFRKLTNNKKNEFIDIYIEMSWKSGLLYVTQDQHTEIFERIGVPLNTQATFKQDDFCSGAKGEEVTNETRKSDCGIAAIKRDIQKEQRQDNFHNKGGNTMHPTTSNPKEDATDKLMLPPNTRLTSRRCTTYFDKKGPVAKKKK